jgi:anti-sigma factor RsiW
MDFLTAAVMIVAITGATVVLVVKILSSAPARIAAVMGAVAVLFAVIPRIVEPLTPAPSAPPASSTTIVAPTEQAPAPATPTAPSAARTETSTTGGAF